MKIKLKELADSVESFKALSNTKLQIAAAYKVSLILKQVETHIESYMDKKQDIFKEYGEEDKEKKAIIIKEENKDKADKKLKELDEITVDIKVKPITIKELGNIQIEPKFLMNPLITD